MDRWDFLETFADELQGSKAHKHDVKSPSLPPCAKLCLWRRTTYVVHLWLERLRATKRRILQQLEHHFRVQNRKFLLHIQPFHE